jgi:hypothetical protein
MALGAVDPSLDPAIAAIQELAQLIRSDNRINSQLMAVRDGVLVVTWVGQTSGSN